MNEGFELFQWPVPSRPALIGLAVGFGILLALAVLVEMLRQRGIRRRRIEKEWRLVKKLAEDKGLSEGERRLLREMIDQVCREEPFLAVSTRRHFNQCVSDYMGAIRRGGSSEYAGTGTALRDIRARLALDFIPLGQCIFTTRELHQGQSVWVRKQPGGGQRWFRLTATKVDEAYVHAAVDDTNRDGRVPPLRPGDELSCRMWREDDARYVFTLKVALLEDDPPRVLLHHAPDLKRVQSRAYYRVKHNQPVTFGIVDAPADGNLENVAQRSVRMHLRGRITSISAGGLALEASQNVPSQVLLRVPLDLPDT